MDRQTDTLPPARNKYRLEINLWDIKMEKQIKLKKKWGVDIYTKIVS